MEKTRNFTSQKNYTFFSIWQTGHKFTDTLKLNNLKQKEITTDRSLKIASPTPNSTNRRQSSLLLDLRFIEKYMCFEQCSNFSNYRQKIKMK